MDIASFLIYKDNMGQFVLEKTDFLLFSPLATTLLHFPPLVCHKEKDRKCYM